MGRFVRWAVALAFLVGLDIAASLFEACSLPETGTLQATDAAGPDVADVTSAIDAPTDSSPDVVVVDVVEEIVPADPSQLTGLELWLIADRGVDGGVADVGDAGDGGISMTDASVTTWTDQSAHQYVAHVSASLPPALQTDLAYGTKATIAFGPQQTLTIDSVNAIPQPYTIFIVGQAAAGGTSNLFFLSANTAALVYRAASPSAPQDTIQISAGAATSANTPLATSPLVVAAVFNGLNSALYGSANTAIGVNAGATAFGGSVTVGSFLPGNPLYSLNGRIAEIALFSRSLPGSEVARLNLYAGARYGITIKP